MPEKSTNPAPLSRLHGALLHAADGLLTPTSAWLAAVRRAVAFARFRHTFTARPDDVFIVTYPRSGTTWMQMILHQLTTGGGFDFVHIAAVCPWFERCPFNGTDLEALPSPRRFKSHLSAARIPWRRCRYIYVARDGRDVLTSFFHFYRTHLGFEGELADFFERFMAGRVQSGSWFEHVAGWWQHREQENVLFLRYEDLLRDLPGQLRVIAAFCNLPLAEADVPAIVENASFAAMKKHSDKFDHANEFLYEMGLKRPTFFRRGQAGDWEDHLSASQQQSFDTTCADRLGGLGLHFGA